MARHETSSDQHMRVFCLFYFNGYEARWPFINDEDNSPAWNRRFGRLHVPMRSSTTHEQGDPFYGVGD